MAIEERVEDAVRGAVMQAGQGGAKMIVHVGAAVAQKMLAAGWQLTRNAAASAKTAISQVVTGGRVSERKLQTLGDVHALKLDESTMPEIAKSLRQAGITYSVDIGQDGSFTLLFQGRDSDHVLHAVNRAFEKLGISFDETPAPAQTQTQTPEPAQKETAATRNDDQPTGDTTREPAEAATPPPARETGGGDAATAPRDDPNGGDVTSAKTMPASGDATDAPGKPRMKTKEELLDRFKNKYQDNLKTARQAARKPPLQTPKLNKR